MSERFRSAGATLGAVGPARWRSLFAESPAFACYLLALAFLPFRWLSPIGSVQQHGEWTDVLVAVAATLWLVEKLRDRTLARSLRRWQIPLALYLILSCVSAAVAVPGRGGSWTTVLLDVELAVLAAITADFAAEAARRRTIARVIVASALVTMAVAVIGAILFYIGVRSDLVGSYGALTASHLYARVQAGFESPPLLSSFCIFASGIAASRDAALSPRLRIATQVSLGLLCVATVSRGVIGFICAVVMRRSAQMEGRRRTVIPIAAALVSVGILAVLSVGHLQFDPGNPTSSTYVVPAPSDRRQAFVTSLKTFEHHPVFGIGPGAPPGRNRAAPFRPHFTPLNVAATLGFPALCALIAVPWLIWRQRRRPTDVALWSALSGVGIDGLAQDIDHFRHVWVLLGLLGS